MNIVYLNHYAGSPEMGMEFRPYYLSREWVKMGHNVRIIGGDFSHLRNKNPIVKNDYDEEIVDGIHYTWIKTGQYQGNGVDRAKTMFRFVFKLWKDAKKIANKWKPDVVIASSTYPLDTYAAQRIAKYSKAKYIHEVHDMWPATLYEIGGMSKKHPFVLLMQIAENSAYKNCDKLVALLPNSKQYMVNHGLSPEKFINIQNGVVFEEFESKFELPEEHSKIFNQLKGKFIVGYFGGHAISNALDLILDTAKNIKDEDTKFVLVGDGVEKKRLIKRAKKEKIDNIIFLPPVSKKQVPTLLDKFDCVLITAEPSPLYRFGLCLNKMYDTMAAGKPVVCVINSPKTLIEEYECGYMANPTDIDDIIKKINAIKSMSTIERNRLGENGKNAIIKNFTYEKLAEKFLNFI
ncbi:MAG: glycosyltransferase family 4 protein [Clostridia bacterium]|nr:glycosyltransferase family 4 protein [Clostridia bacterium]